MIELTKEEAMVAIAALNFTRNHSPRSWERRDEDLLRRLMDFTRQEDEPEGEDNPGLGVREPVRPNRPNPSLSVSDRAPVPERTLELVGV